MIKTIWNAIHFGRFKSQWRNELPGHMSSPPVELGRTLFYENRIESGENGYELITEPGGYIGKHAFYFALPIYALLAFGIATGVVSMIHLLVFELIFIGVFGVLNGWAIHRLIKDPAFGVEELSLRRVQID